MTVDSARSLALSSPLAGTFYIIDRFDNDPDPVTHARKGFTDAPSLVRAGDGALICAAPQYCLGRSQERGHGRLFLYRSADEGNSWERVDGEWSFLCGKLFRFEESLYFVGVGPTRWDGLHIIRSLDHGKTWSDPVLINNEAPYYSPSTGTVLRDGILYLSLGVANEEGVFNAGGSRTRVAAVKPTDMMNPAAWRFSAMLAFPPYPDSFREPDVPDDVMPSHWLEGNVVDTPDGLKTYWRTRIDGMRSLSVCPVCAIDDTHGQLEHHFQNFRPFPGANCHFHIIQDAPSRLYWLLCNPLRRRNILALFCSADAKHWLCTGYPAILPGWRQAASYVTPLPDGEDLLIVSRTAWKSLNNHDNDLVTFHRVPDFRQLAKPFNMTSSGAVDL